jgi:hypothetical protein
MLAQGVGTSLFKVATGAGHGVQSLLRNTRSLATDPKLQQAIKSTVEKGIGIASRLKADASTSIGARSIPRLKKVGGGLAKAGKTTGHGLWRFGRGIVNHPGPFMGAAFAGGLTAGGIKHVIQASEQRTAQSQNRFGMDPNNLGTDGLTIALSRRRHR